MMLENYPWLPIQALEVGNIDSDTCLTKLNLLFLFWEKKHSQFKKMDNDWIFPSKELKIPTEGG